MEGADSQEAAPFRCAQLSCDRNTVSGPRLLAAEERSTKSKSARQNVRSGKLPGGHFVLDARSLPLPSRTRNIAVAAIHTAHPGLRLDHRSAAHAIVEIDARLPRHLVMTALIANGTGQRGEIERLAAYTTCKSPTEDAREQQGLGCHVGKSPCVSEPCLYRGVKNAASMRCADHGMIVLHLG